MKTLATINRCIYCDGQKNLSDEHVLPASLGGKLTLKKASCDGCAKITSRFEGQVTRAMYWPLRLSLGGAFAGRKKHKHERPTHWEGVLEDGDSIEEAPIEVGKFPKVYSVMKFVPPGILRNEALTNGNPAMEIRLKGNPSEVSNFVNEMNVGKLEISHTLQWAPFTRMVAKICHAFARGVVGDVGVDFILPPLIVGQSNHLSHLIGGIADHETGLEPPNDLMLTIREIDGKSFLFGRTTFFGEGRFPTYEAVVGPVTDREAVNAKIMAMGSAAML